MNYNIKYINGTYIAVDNKAGIFLPDTLVNSINLLKLNIYDGIQMVLPKPKIKTKTCPVFVQICAKYVDYILSKALLQNEIKPAEYPKVTLK